MGKYSVLKLPSDILRSTAQNVAALRKDQRLTQQELAKKSGVSYGSVKRFETTGKISFESLLKIAEALQRLSDFEDLFVLPFDNQKIKDLFKAANAGS